MLPLAVLPPVMPRQLVHRHGDTAGVPVPAASLSDPAAGVIGLSLDRHAASARAVRPGGDSDSVSVGVGLRSGRRSAAREPRPGAGLLGGPLTRSNARSALQGLVPAIIRVAP